jgi:hypothetical protein
MSERKNPTANTGRTTIPGLCLVGYCKNCKKQDWSPLGMGSFYMAEKIRTVTCFTCGKKLYNVTGAAIYRCLLIGKGEIEKS